MRLVTSAEMRAIDSAAYAEFGVPTLLLMENAGAAISRHALAMSRRRPTTPHPSIAIYCGKGNNGGDGLVAARHLVNLGCEVRIFIGEDLSSMRGDAAVNAEIIRRSGIPVELLRRAPRRPWTADLVVDAILGTGLRGEVTGGPAVLVESVRRSDAPVLAVDVPSGLDSDSGRLATSHVVAHTTVTLGLPKLGMALYPGRGAVGEMRVEPIGLPAPLLGYGKPRVELTDEEVVASWLVPRPATANKGDAGRVFVVAGSEGMTGAGALASSAAVRGGAGLVTLGVGHRMLPVLAARLTEVMTLGLTETATGAPNLGALPVVLSRANANDALAVGPGLGRYLSTGKLVRALVDGYRGPMVVDADALNLLSPGKPGSFSPKTVLTPHPGELARLRATTIPEVEADRVSAVRDAARFFKCIVLLKGAATLIADPGGRLAVNSTGTPGMASGGCGDALTGLIVALLAQGMPPFEAAAAGAYLHGLAGELAADCISHGSTGIGMTASDLIEQIPRARASIEGRGHFE